MENVQSNRVYTKENINKLHKLFYKKLNDNIFFVIFFLKRFIIFFFFATI